MSVAKELDVEKIKRRDESALRDFFDRLVPQLYRYASRRAMALDPVDVDELVNDTVFRIFKNIDSIAETKAPYHYCMAVMKNVVHEYLRRSQKMKEVQLETLTDREDTDEALEFQIPAVDTLHNLETLADAESALKNAMGPLSETDKKLIQMRLEGMTFEEIANALELSLPLARFRYYKMISVLRYRLKSDAKTDRAS